MSESTSFCGPPGAPQVHRRAVTLTGSGIVTPEVSMTVTGRLLVKPMEESSSQQRLTGGGEAVAATAAATAAAAAAPTESNFLTRSGSTAYKTYKVII